MATALRDANTMVKFDQKQRWDVADVFRGYGHEYKQNYPLSYAQQKTMTRVMACRTEFLGGQRELCNSCGYERLVFKSCRDRHCPKCQATVKAKWLQSREKELLPVAYFHVVFTLPHELNALFLNNKKVIGDLFFRAISETLLQFGKNPKNGLAGKIGFLAILHTWDQKLLDHFHIHCLVPAGALADDGCRWIHPKRNYLFPVAALSVVFRGKFIDFLTAAYNKGLLRFSDRTEPLGLPDGFKDFTKKLWGKKWVVYSKPAMWHPKQVLEYLARYVHRVAISNYRIKNVQDGKVTFSYKDRKDNNTQKEMTIEATEFIRRFLLHLLPMYFMKIRAYGFWANRSKREKLTRCQELLHVKKSTTQSETKTTIELICEMIGFDITRCPHCKKGAMKIVESITPLLSKVTIYDLFFLSSRGDTS